MTNRAAKSELSFSTNNEPNRLSAIPRLTRWNIGMLVLLAHEFPAAIHSKLCKNCIDPKLRGILNYSPMWMS